MKSKILNIILTVLVAVSFSDFAQSKNPPLFPKNDNSFGVKADNPALGENVLIQIPVSLKKGEVATLNKKGFMKVDLDDFSKEFIRFSINQKDWVMDVGAAYGVTILPILKGGGKVIANDIDHRHLLVIRKETPRETWKNLYLNYGKFPEDIEIPENSLRAILICRVAHFFKEEEIEETIKKSHKILKPGGKLFFITMSPYHHKLNGFIETYNKRWEKGVKWPGIIADMHKYAPELAPQIPKFVHVIEHRPMKKALEREGFRIEKMSLFNYHKSKKKKEEKILDKEIGSYFGFIASKK